MERYLRVQNTLAVVWDVSEGLATMQIRVLHQINLKDRPHWVQEKLHDVYYVTIMNTVSSFFYVIFKIIDIGILLFELGWRISIKYKLLYYYF